MGAALRPGGLRGERGGYGGDGERQRHGLPHTWGSQPPNGALSRSVLWEEAERGGGEGLRGVLLLPHGLSPQLCSRNPKIRVLLSASLTSLWGSSCGQRGCAAHMRALRWGLSTCRKPRQERLRGAGVRLGTVLCPQLCTLCCCSSAQPTRARAPRRAVTQPRRPPRYSPLGAGMKF